MSQACSRRGYGFALALLLAVVSWSVARADLVLVEHGKNPLPIVVFKDAPHWTLNAANELADYIEQASGARPAVIQGEPSPIPDKAIWVGYQPALGRLFPKVNFNFENPEEICFVSNDNHLVIAGRDKWDPTMPEGVDRNGKTYPGLQQEYGTVNAVYTFLQDHLGVRFFYPGPGGEDVPKQSTIAVNNLDYRYHPQFRQRRTVLRFSGLSYNSNPVLSGDWVRKQRMQLDSLDAPIQGHGFGDWWERFHETHPEYFALQPDGTRSGYPEPRTVKLCDSNPAVWDQWVEDVAAQLEKDPHQTVFSAAPNDSYHRGHCVCENCRAWDHPDAEKLNFVWQGVSELYPAISDRHVTFANMLGRRLKERFPDKKLYVMMYSYGHSRPAPVAARPDDNVIICGVHNFHLRESQARENGMNDMHAWGKVVSSQMWRPNLGTGTVGWTWGMPDISPQQVIHDFRLVADAGGMGMSFDSVWEHWANQGIHYYMMAQMIWNPYQDGQAVLEDYYHRAYGPAYEPMKKYWSRLEEIRDSVASNPDLNIVLDMPIVYSPAVLDELTSLMEEAKAKTAHADEGFAQRVAFARVGLEFTKKIVAIRTLMIQYEAGDLKDAKLAQQVMDQWSEVQKLRDEYPTAVNWQRIREGGGRWQAGLNPKNPSRLRRGPSANASKMKGIAQEVNTSAEAAGWKLAFADDFGRDSLGDAWQTIKGAWSIENGRLQGSGLLMTAQGYPGGEDMGYQRIEFDAVSLVDDPQANICDISSVLHSPAVTSAGEEQLKQGYFIQFGGFNNQRNAIRKQGQPLVIDRQPQTLITRGKSQHVICEIDQGRIRLIVDGVLVMQHVEKSSLLGHGQDRLGIYTETHTAIDNVKIYVKKLDGGLDLE